MDGGNSTLASRPDHPIIAVASATIFKNTCGTGLIPRVQSSWPKRMTDEQDMTGKATRDTSSIQFPYADLEDAIKVARAILDYGGVPLDRDQLASKMGQTPNSGNFGIKLASARMFGFVDNVAGKNALTPLGFEVLDAAREKAAMAQAFLNVPLYRRAYDEFKGRQLPPRPHGLEQAFQNFGVAPKQKDKARHVFDRSARLAGYFPTSQEDRLVAPVISDAPSDDNAPQKRDMSDMVQVEYVPPPLTKPRLHPFIDGLLEELPPAKTDWSSEQRATWLEAAAAVFDLIYKGNTGDILIAVDPEAKNAKGEP